MKLSVSPTTSSLWRAGQSLHLVRHANSVPLTPIASLF
jgi:hypothetical protein